MNRKLWIRKATGALICASAVAIVGCNNNQPPASGAPANPATAAAPASAASAAQTAAPYTPPSADQLYQMVAPIALFPDKLIAQVLAGSTYPDQITAADNVLVQNPNLKGASVQTAIAQQPWDPSVKGLTAFPAVLDQMAQNIAWTTSLGEAYVNDPTDVMNAIQVMRQRATKHGNLRSSAQLSVTTQPESAQPASYVDNSNGGYPVYSGPAVVPAPGEVIEIAPAQPDTVYVPQYDPQTVYGQEVPYYPGYAYERPREYSTGEIVTVGALSFGAGILIGTLFEHHHDRQDYRQDYGWQNWGMNWGGRGNNGGDNNGGGWQRPAVVYNNSTYVSRSTTVVNRYVTNNTVNNINNSNNVNNVNNSRNTTYNNSNINSNNQRNTATPSTQHIDNRGVTNPAPAMMHRPAASVAPAAAKPMSIPHFGTPVRGAAPVRNEHAMVMPGRVAPTPAMPHPTNIPPRPAMPPHSVSLAQRHLPAQMPAARQPNPSMVSRPVPPPSMPQREMAHPAPPVMTHQPAPHAVIRPQPEHAPPRPIPQAQVAPPRPEAARPQPTPRPEAARPQPAPRPEPVREPHAPAAPAVHNEARPAAPAPHAPNDESKKKKDDNQNGH